MPLDEALGEKDGVFGAAVEEALLARLNLKLGDIIRIGEASSPCAQSSSANRTGWRPASGSGRARSFRKPLLKPTKLVQPGSLVRWTTRVVMGGPDGAPDMPPSELHG